MDLQFPKESCSYLSLSGGEVKTLEETLEVKLPDSLPDIGKVLWGWGQALIRSKQWNRDSVGLSGGVMAWVLYAPEDGSEIRSVECWIPVQARWDIPAREHDGVILAGAQLLGVDGRSLSARKMMVRASVALTARAMVENRQDIYQPPEDWGELQLRREKQTLLLPKEAGEKMLQLEESIPAPGTWQPKKLLHYSICPQVTDCKLMADRAVFRGSALGHSLCRDENGELQAWDFDIPFSQYTELDREYGDRAQLQVSVVPTGLEMELGENGNLEIKGSMIGQYLVLDSQELDLVTDGYSPQRQVTLEQVALELPGAQLVPREDWQSIGSIPGEFARVVDCGFLLQPPQPRLYGENQADLGGKWQLCGTDSEGNWISDTLPWQDTWPLPQGEQAALWLEQSGPCSALSGEMQTRLSGGGYMVETMTVPMVTGVKLGDAKPREETRPSLVLKKAGGESLWDMAKQHNTTVQRILDANSLTQEPAGGTWLLIPVP